jgi:glycosyltransferase involved in cell wall biosynthesis
MRGFSLPPANPLVSIGLPVYNGEPYLEGAIRSLLGQDYPGLELVVADNASTDNTEEICRDYASLDARVRYHRAERNAGMIRNLKRVFGLARGDVFMWAGHDDQWAPTFVSELLQPLVADAACVASFCHFDVWYRREKTEVVRPGPMPSLSLANPAFENLRQLLLFPQSPLFYGLFRRRAVAQTAMIREDYFDWGDVYFLHEMCLLGRMSITPKVLFHSGVPGGKRTPKSLSPRRLPGFNYAYSAYVRKTARLIARATGFPAARKARLLLLLMGQTIGFFRSAEPIARPFRLPLRLSEKLIICLDREPPPGDPVHAA